LLDVGREADTDVVTDFDGVCGLDAAAGVVTRDPACESLVGIGPSSCVNSKHTVTCFTFKKNSKCIEIANLTRTTTLVECEFVFLCQFSHFLANFLHDLHKQYSTKSEFRHKHQPSKIDIPPHPAVEVRTSAPLPEQCECARTDKKAKKRM
jgi:hypothetical protein